MSGAQEEKKSRNISLRIYASISGAVDLPIVHTRSLMTPLLIADPLFMSFTKPCQK